jgi:hypothetical protein
MPQALSLAVSLPDLSGLAAGLKPVAAIATSVAALVTGVLKVADAVATRQRGWLRARRFDNSGWISLLQREKPDERVDKLVVVVIHGRVFQLLHRLIGPKDSPYVPVALVEWPHLATQSKDESTIVKDWDFPPRAAILARWRPWKGYDERVIKPRQTRLQAFRLAKKPVYVRFKRRVGRIERPTGNPGNPGTASDQP